MHQKLSKAEVLSHCPTFNEENLTGGFMYFDARVDDARLTLNLARTAAFHGASVVNHAKAVEITRNGHGSVDGVIVQADEREIRVRADVVIMATGVWLRDWNGRKKDDPAALQIRPAKGVHVAIPWLKIRNDCTVTIPVPGRNRRATITRWGNVSYLGTTDEDYRGNLDDVCCTRQELDFLIEGARSALKTDLCAEDAVGSIAGCRPLVGPPGGKRDAETVANEASPFVRPHADHLLLRAVAPAAAMRRDELAPNVPPNLFRLDQRSVEIEDDPSRSHGQRMSSCCRASTAQIAASVFSFGQTWTIHPNTRGMNVPPAASHASRVCIDPRNPKRGSPRAALAEVDVPVPRSEAERHARVESVAVGRVRRRVHHADHAQSVAVVLEDDRRRMQRIEVPQRRLERVAAVRVVLDRKRHAGQKLSVARRFRRLGGRVLGHDGARRSEDGVGAFAVAGALRRVQRHLHVIAVRRNNVCRASAYEK